MCHKEAVFRDEKTEKKKIKGEDTKETLLEEDRRKAILAKRCLFYSSFSFCYCRRAEWLMLRVEFPLPHFFKVFMRAGQVLYPLSRQK